MTKSPVVFVFMHPYFDFSTGGVPPVENSIAGRGFVLWEGH